jgi:hypothetical protein
MKLIKHLLFLMIMLSLTTACEQKLAEIIDETTIEIDENTSLSITSSYTIVGTGVTKFYNNNSEISAPTLEQSFYGQDAHHQTNMPSYMNNNDGTITDNITGLMWEQSMGDKITFDEASSKATNSSLGGHTDWRVPKIKELYSLILFTGSVQGASTIEKFIDTEYFTQALGNTAIGEREIDAQTWSSTEYVGRTMNSDETVFGVNFIDGRIKGYPKYKQGSGLANIMYFRMVRGNIDYGKNNFIDNENGTISDLATGLMWQQNDNSSGMNWEEALSYAQTLNLGANNDWRLPNAKELQSIIDYSRSVQTNSSAAINQIFNCTPITDPDGDINFGYYWTSTTHLDGVNPESHAVYVCFGEGQGKMNGTLMDVHGAGAQRSDPKSGNAADYPQFFGPQGDVRYVYNLVRCVRNIN